MFFIMINVKSNSFKLTQHPSKPVPISSSSQSSFLQFLFNLQPFLDEKLILEALRVIKSFILSMDQNLG